MPDLWLDLPGDVVKDQPHSVVGTPVANATTGLEWPLSNEWDDRPRGRKRSVPLGTGEVEGAGHGGGPAECDRVGHVLGRCRR